MSRVFISPLATPFHSLVSIFPIPSRYISIFRAPPPRYFSPSLIRQCCEPGSVQRVLEILYLKCERSDENEPLLRRRELLEKQGQRFGLRQIRRAVERGELPARLDVELASIYLQSLWDGICGTLAWTERLRDDPWNRAERMFRAGLDSLRSSPYLLLADA